MNKKIFVIVAIGLVLLSSLIVFPVSSSSIETTSNGITIYVDDDFNSSTPGWGVDHFDVIQDAIDNATSGDTVFVYTGKYTYCSITSKSINLIGENRESTIINGGIYLSSEKVNISNFKICNAERCIQLEGGGFNNISGNLICNNELYGIIIRNSNNNAILYNILVNNSLVGIYVYEETSNNIIKYNKISENHYGIYIFLSKNNYIENNDITKNEIGVRISYEDYSHKNNKIFNNNFISNDEHARCEILGSFRINYFYGNYWGRARIFPYLISGDFYPIPSNIDWRPALRPYDIPGIGGVD